MKIRTDFVTNSSGSNTVEIIIDNPLLLEILQRYKDLGLLAEGHQTFVIGTYQGKDPIWGDPNYDYRASLDHIVCGEHSNTPAWVFINKDVEILGGHDYPRTLNEVLDAMLSIIVEPWIRREMDETLFNQLMQEINQRKSEINHRFVKVSWFHEYKEGEDKEIMEFNYDPANGESFTEEDLSSYPFEEDE